METLAAQEYPSSAHQKLGSEVSNCDVAHSILKRNPTTPQSQPMYSILWYTNLCF